MSEKRLNDLPKTSKEDDESRKEYEELSELLDSALADFASQKKIKEMDNSNQDNSNQDNSNQDNSNQDNSDDQKEFDSSDILWDDEFLRLTTAQLEENMHFLFNSDEPPLSGEEVGENIQRMTEAVAEAEAANEEASSDFDFSEAVAQTLNNLSENMENIQDNVPDNELMNMLGTFNSLANPNADSSEIIPLMQHLMQTLLSKELLVPSLTSLIEKYPQWLEENRSKLTSHEYEKHSEQIQVMKDICAELDKETPNDSTDVKSERFNRILELMQQMQDCGHPPSELVENINPVLGLDSQGNPHLPPNFINQCILM